MMHQLIDKKNKIIIYVIFLFLLSTTNEKFSKKQKNYSLKIDNINIVGLSSDKNSEIFNELNNILYKNIFILGKEEINNIIGNHNIIAEYSIKKIYPSRLDISIKPTKLIAKISNNSQLLVGENGKIILDKENYQILPIIFGEFRSKKFLEFKENIDHSKFNFANFRTIYFFPSNRWDVLTKDNVLIKLPQNNLLESLNLAYKIVTNDKFKSKNIIDLRIINNLIIE